MTFIRFMALDYTDRIGAAFRVRDIFAITLDDRRLSRSDTRVTGALCSRRMRVCMCIRVYMCMHVGHEIDPDERYETRARDDHSERCELRAVCRISA